MTDVVRAAALGGALPGATTNSHLHREWWVEHEVDSGGQARVYKIRGPSRGEPYALKVPRTSDRSAAARLRREGARLASVHHPNLVSVFGVVELGERPALLLEWVDGTSLADVLVSPWWTAGRVDEISLPLLSAVAVLHRAGVVHRDIKAQNVVVAGGPHAPLVPKLIDLGFARGESTDRITGSEDMVGSEDWAAPEQLRGADPHPTADVWSLGVLLFRMVTGRDPFPEGGGLLDRYRVRAQGRFLDPLAVRPHLDPRIAEILRRTLDPDPARRPRDGGELRDLWSPGRPPDVPLRHDGALFTGEQYTTGRAPVDLGPVVLRTAGPWTLESLVGEGRDGGVWRARHGRTGQVAAAKVFRPRSARRFAMEVEALRRVRSDHVVRLVDGVWGPSPVLVTGLVDGPSLETRVTRDGPLSGPHLDRLGRQLLRGVSDLHAVGVIHRDLSPSNVLLDSRFEVRIADLASSGFVGSGSEGCVGTLGFAAPEQLVDPRGADARADVFGCGAVLYFAATGELPFDGTCRWDRILATLDGHHLPLERRRPDLPRWLTAVVDRALAPDRDARWKDGADLLRAWTGERQPRISWGAAEHAPP